MPDKLTGQPHGTLLCRGTRQAAVTMHMVCVAPRDENGHIRGVKKCRGSGRVMGHENRSSEKKKTKKKKR